MAEEPLLPLSSRIVAQESSAYDLTSEPLLPLSSRIVAQESSAYGLISELESGTNGSLIPKNATQVSEITFPEGGLRAWLVVFGGFCLSMSTFGYVISWGTFQAFYELGPLANISPSAIAWIGSLQYSLIFLPGILTGRLFDLGYFRLSLLGSTVLYIVTNFLIAECREYWQFILCQGVAFGLACGWIYIPCVATVSHWFKVKRPVVFTVVAFGSSVGGVLFPIIFRNLLPRVGFQWTVRTIAFINAGSFIIANLTMRTRLPVSTAGKEFFNIRAFLSLPYVTYTLSTSFCFLGLYTYLTFVTVSAETIGISPSLSFYLVAVINGVSAFGRLISGVLALKYGPLNIMIIFTTVAAITTYIWPSLTGHGSFIIVTSIYGLTSGAFIGLFPVPVTLLGDMHNVGERTGFQMSVMALGALGGPPISGAILDHGGSFRPVGVYAGTMIITGVLTMILTRVLALGRLVGGKI